MIGSLFFFDEDHQTHRIDAAHDDRRTLISQLTDMVPTGCHVAGIIVDEPALPLMIVPRLPQQGLQAHASQPVLDEKRTG